MKILEKEQGLESHRIRIKLEEAGHGITYDTVSRNLKRMVDDRQLIRCAEGRDVNENTGIKHWNYYYKITGTKTS